jgi:hypothetical protein
MPVLGKRPNVFAAPVAKAYRPTMRDQVANVFSRALGDTYQSNELARGLFGSSGLGGGQGNLLGGLGILDLTPIGAAFALEEAGRQIGGGDVVGGVANAALAAVPIPASARGARFKVKKLPKPPTARITGVGPKALNPRSDFSTPLVPTREQMQQFSRVERVPFDAAEAHERAAYRRWDDFNSASHPGAVVDGYSDLPLAVKLNNGKYVVYDGHHRAELMRGRGDESANMFVIDAAKYDPENAGRRPSKNLTPEQQRKEADDILKALGLK